LVSKKIHVAFCGGGNVKESVMKLAEKVGYRLAESGDFVFCTGGYGGIMEAPLKGVADYETITGNKRRRVGYLLNVKPQANEYVKELIVCGKPDDSPELSLGIRLGEILAYDIIIFFKGSDGTKVEELTALHLVNKAKALGLKKPKFLILVCKKGQEDEATEGLWSTLRPEQRALFHCAETPEDVVNLVKKFLA
jgi:predicted Rossmann-fold nucleotide-binding protein